MPTANTQAPRRASLLPRLVAPLAIVAVVVVLVVVISGSMSSSDDSTHHAARHGQGQHQVHHPQQPRADTYVVQSGDTLGGIAAKTGVSVEDLQRLNPDIDTQALVPGSTLKLR
jgi:LysM repeat protein